MKCYEIKKCPFNCKEHTNSKCPPHKLQIGCWEFDWASFYNKMPACKEKLDWRNYMLKGCPNCEIYVLYKEEIDNFLEKLINL